MRVPTLICDVTKGVPLKTNSVDFIYSNNCFEHINAPWLAAKELTRILKPGGHIFVSAPWAWRYHPVPIDYWRYSPEALEYIFTPLSTVEKGFNTFYRRFDSRGKFPNKMDSVPIDELGGWRENWLSYYFGTKVSPSPVPLLEQIEGVLGRLGIRQDPKRWPTAAKGAA